MSLHRFDEKNVLKTCGMVNTGTICYLNSFLQSLLACTSLTKFFMENEERYVSENNKVAIEYINLIKKIKEVKSHNDVISPVGIFREIVTSAKKKFPNKQFGRGQEDSGEGLHLFLDAIDDKELYKYFMYKYVVKIWCLTCVKQISEKKDESCVLEIPPKYSGITDDDTKDIHPLNSHMRQYISMLDDYTCPTCKKKECCRIYQLACAPEIFVVMFNKFFKKENINFPDQLSFPASDLTTLNYKMVAKIEHSGGRNGGHYWAHCYRSGEPTTDSEQPQRKMYSLNDRGIGPGNTTPTEESYMVFYHNI